MASYNGWSTAEAATYFPNSSDKITLRKNNDNGRLRRKTTGKWKNTATAFG